MTHPHPCRLLPAALLILSPLVTAAKSDPSDPAAAVPPAAHTSAFKNYRAHRDEAITSWRAANDEVARIGGWRTYARETRQPDALDAPDANVPVPAKSGASAPAPRGPAAHPHP